MLRRAPRRLRSAWFPALSGAGFALLPCSSIPAQSASAGSLAPTHGSVITVPDSTWLVQDSAARACLDTLSVGSLRPVVVYQMATASDTSRAVLDEVALISEHIGEHARTALGGGNDIVPNADTLVAWRHLAGPVPVRIVVHREAATTWSIDSGADAAKANVATFYSTVLRTMPGDDLNMVWPPNLAPDSIVVDLVLSPTDSAKQPLPRPGYPMIAVFRTRGVAFTPAMVRRDSPTPAYPVDAIQQRIGADVIANIVVRPSGFADGTTRSVVISSRDPMGSRARDHFVREFTSVVERVVKRMRFEPAMIGGCAVPQQAVFPFTFSRG